MAAEGSNPAVAAMQAGGDLMSVIGTGLFNQHSANKAMKFSEYMSSTAYQRAVKDMRAAGLNPILAAGSPASSPSGSAAVIADPKLGSSFGQASTAVMQRHLMREQADQATTQATKNVVDAGLSKANTEVAHESAETQKSLRGLYLAQAVSALSSARQATAVADKTETTNVAYPYAKQLVEDPVQYFKDMGSDFANIFRRRGTEVDTDPSRFDRPSNARQFFKVK